MEVEKPVPLPGRKKNLRIKEGESDGRTKRENRGGEGDGEIVRVGD